jgi:hypothetical protein
MLNIYNVRALGLEVDRRCRRNAPNFNREGDMDRHSFMLKKYSEQKLREKKEKDLWRARQEVDINANGTSGYTVKDGPNKGRVLGHRVTKSTNNW